MRPIILLAVFVSSCATQRGIRLPVGYPQGALCTHKADLGIVICTDLETGLPIGPISILETDKWIMFSPGSYQSVKDYMDELEVNATL